MIRIEEYDSPYGAITVARSKSTGALIYSQGGCRQSEADDNGVSVASYIHAIFGLIAQLRAKTVLMIGCGGGTLATMLARSGCQVTIVDVNPAAFHIARQYFDLPDSIDCQVADGRQFLLSSQHRYDAIILDAFQGDRMPTHLRSRAFFALVRPRLTRRGAVFANIHVKTGLDRTYRITAENMTDVWSDVRLLDSPGWQDRNAIVMAGNVAQLQQPVLLIPPAVDANVMEEELATMEFHAW